jgi:hypothetical protein
MFLDEITAINRHLDMLWIYENLLEQDDIFNAKEVKRQHIKAFPKCPECKVKSNNRELLNLRF